MYRNAESGISAWHGLQPFSKLILELRALVRMCHLRYSDQGKEFENQLVKELQIVLGDKKTRTTPYRPHGNSVLARVRSTMFDMSTMYFEVLKDKLMIKSIS